MLLHGFGACDATWRFWAPQLARRFTVHLVEMRGFGRAPAPDPPSYSPVEMAEDVVRMVLSLDLRDVTLIGHSIGGGVALLATLRLADAGEGGRVRRLVSIAGTAYEQDLPRYVNMLLRPPTRWLLQLVPTRWLVRKVIESIVFDPGAVSDEQVEGYAAPLSRWRVKRAAVAAAAQLVPENLERITARYPEIRVPTLILSGRQDPVVPLWVGERLAREMREARLVVLERCGHIPPEERPRESLAVVEAFLSEVGEATGT